MFRPNTTCRLSRLGSSYTINGEAILEPAIIVPCAVVHLNRKVEKTTVRADASASRGAAEEAISQSVLLFPTSVKIAIDDKVEIAGLKLRVTSVEPRFAVTGRHDHTEVALGIAGE